MNYDMTIGLTTAIWYPPAAMECAERRFSASCRDSSGVDLSQSFRMTFSGGTGAALDHRC